MEGRNGVTHDSTQPPGRGMTAPIARRALGLLALAPALARAQPAWPTRPVRIIVPWAAGGAVDIVARLLAARLADALGQPFPVENRTGGGGIIGFGEAARAAADGYTLLALDNSYTMLPHTTERLPWNVDQAFAPIVLGAAAPFLLVVNAASRFRTMAELIAAARAAPETLSYGTGGAGSSPHFVAEAFQQAAGIKLLHVPFRGGAEAMMAVIAGQVDCSMATVPIARGHVEGGRLRALGFAADTRSRLLPDVPSFAELGLGEATGGIWAGLAAPAGTPAAILDRIDGVVQAALRDAAFRQRLMDQGLEPGGLDRQQFAALVQRDTARWGRVATAAGMARQ